MISSTDQGLEDDPVLSALQRYRDAAGSTFHPRSEAQLIRIGCNWIMKKIHVLSQVSMLHHVLTFVGSKAVIEVNCNQYAFVRTTNHISNPVCEWQLSSTP